MLRLRRVVTTTFNASNLHLIRKANKICQCAQNDFLRHQITFGANYTTDLDTDEKAPKKKTQKIPKITLLHPDNSVTVTLLEDAQKLAKKQKLELIQVLNNDPKNDRSVYKLVSPTQLIEVQDNDEEIKEHHRNKQRRKSTKLFTLKCKINEHDLRIKINNINKVLKKGHKVKIFLTHPDGGQDNVLQCINREVQGTVSSEKVQKGCTIFTYSPLLEDHGDSTNEPQNKNAQVT